MQPYTQSQQEFLGSLLSVVIMKMKYDDESDWGNDEDEPEEEALFMEMRKVSDQENHAWKSLTNWLLHRTYVSLLIISLRSMKNFTSITSTRW